MPTKTKIILVYILVLAINTWAYFNPTPEFLGGRSNDGLPGYADFLIPIFLILIILGASVYIVLNSRKLKSKILGVIFLLVIAFAPNFFFSIFTDSKYLIGNIENSIYENREAGFLKGIDVLCAGSNIEYLIVPIKDIGSLPIREVEYKCGNKIGVYDILYERPIDLKNCNNQFYNNLMRDLGSYKRKSCI